MGIDFVSRPVRGGPKPTLGEEWISSDCLARRRVRKESDLVRPGIKMKASLREQAGNRARLIDRPRKDMVYFVQKRNAGGHAQIPPFRCVRQQGSGSTSHRPEGSAPATPL